MSRFGPTMDFEEHVIMLGLTIAQWRELLAGTVEDWYVHQRLSTQLELGIKALQDWDDMGTIVSGESR